MNLLECDYKQVIVGSYLRQIEGNEGKDQKVLRELGGDERM